MEKEENKSTIISQPLSTVDPILVHILCILPASFFLMHVNTFFYRKADHIEHRIL